MYPVMVYHRQADIAEQQNVIQDSGISRRQRFRIHLACNHPRLGQASPIGCPGPSPAHCGRYEFGPSSPVACPSRRNTTSLGTVIIELNSTGSVSHAETYRT